MFLTSFQPLHPLGQLRREMDRLFSGVLGDGPELSWPAPFRGQAAANLWESPDAFHLEMELPGVKPEQLDVSVVNDELTIKVDRPNAGKDAEKEEVTYHRRERPAGSFTRTIRLPADVDAAKVEAELQQGVLTLRLPKAESALPHKVHVRPKSN